ncbi:unnamed protein product, partial [Polarella glacialis]
EAEDARRWEEQDTAEASGQVCKHEGVDRSRGLCVGRSHAIGRRSRKERGSGRSDGRGR